MQLTPKIERTGKVIVSDLLARGNKIFTYNQPVTESNFGEDRWNFLVENGFIKEDTAEVKFDELKTRLSEVKKDFDNLSEKVKTPAPTSILDSADIGKHKPHKKK